MRRKTAAFLLLCAGVLLCTCGSETVSGPAETPILNILFIGNSYTFWNDMPQMFEQLSNAINDDVMLDVRSATLPGAALETHWNEGTAVAALKSAGWDYVILQDNPGLSAVAPEIMYDYMTRFDSLAALSGAETILFLPWAVKDNQPYQAALDSTHCYIAGELGAAVAPVGPAWWTVFDEYPELDLYDSDGSHPNRKGSFLISAVMYAKIFNREPEGFPVSYSVGTVSRTICTLLESEKLQRIAWETVSAYIQ